MARRVKWPNIKPGQLVNYRYMSYPPGFIRAVDKDNDRVLLDVDFLTEKFCKWVHVTSVNPQPIRFPINHFAQR
jgi:hypothetical protein